MQEWRVGDGCGVREQAMPLGEVRTAYRQEQVFEEAVGFEVLIGGVAKGDGGASSVKSGAPGKIRTPDLFLRREALYPAELRAQAPRGAKSAGRCA